MKRLAGIALITLALAVTAGFASAETTTWKVDGSHTTVQFKVKHFFTHVTGQFNDFEGSIAFDDKNPANIKVDATAHAASVFTDNERRDNHLKSGDFFDVEKFPDITFKSTKVAAAGKDKYKITGDFTMRGVTKPVTFDAEFLGSGSIGTAEKPMAKAGFTATAVIQRKDYGMTWNRTLDKGGLMLGDDVTIVINVEADQAQ